MAMMKAMILKFGEELPEEVTELQSYHCFLIIWNRVGLRSGAVLCRRLSIYCGQPLGWLISTWLAHNCVVNRTDVSCGATSAGGWHATLSRPGDGGIHACRDTANVFGVIVLVIAWIAALV
ncbi:hypothetical protein BKA62DRAFT_675469 [Auriculariales sp. MPI-PUGE-AT-0066]|nr:hypothetical protein BKA62DRAFT_675469 [Auriculariales sp. MPI-PUGE-AT-0066]